MPSRQATPEADITSPIYLAELREATLILLYRLLFLLYAEDRNLLPVRDNRYDDYALRKIREGIAERRDTNDTLSNTASRYWQHLTDLFRIIAKGDASIGMPAHNGGLFEENRAPLLGRSRLPDARFAPCLTTLHAVLTCCAPGLITAIFPCSISAAFTSAYSNIA